jgi:hypothetical protein
MTNNDLIVWIVLGIFTAAIDGVMAHRRYSGKLGEQVRAKYLNGAELVGGRRNLLIISVVGDLLLWPLGLGGCLRAWNRDWRIYQAELARSARQAEAD